MLETGAAITPGTARPVASSHEHACMADDDHGLGPRSEQSFWVRSIDLNLQAMRRLGLLMLLAGGALAFLPLHPNFVCPIRAATGVPCPTCGLTTSIKSCLRLDMGAAFAANPAGPLAILFALVLFAWRPKTARVPLIAVPALAAAMWIFQLFRFSIL